MSLKEFKCPSCGGSLAFNIENQNLKCDYCKNEYDIDSEPYENKGHTHHNHEEKHYEDEDGTVWSIDGQSWDEEEEENLVLYTCDSCGGEIIGDETMASTSCPFCTNNVVIPSQFSGDLRPDFLIPFKLDKERAKSALKSFYKGRKLLPKVFSEENHIEEIKGIYVPFWLFSGKSTGDMVFTGTKVRVYSDSRYDYTETSYYNIKRGGTLDFQYVPVDGSSKIDNLIMESIEPFKWEDAMEFDSGFLAGFLANRYDVDSEDSIDYAKERIKNTTLASFRRSVQGYQTVQVERADQMLEDVKINYALVPVWFLNTEWEGKFYTFAMNGQTGRIVGDDMPIDKGLYYKKFFLYAIISGLIIFVIAMLVFKYV